MTERDVYFLSNIVYDDELKNKALTLLECVGNKTDTGFIFEEFDKDNIKDFVEGNFVYYLKNMPLENANIDSKAKGEFYKNNIYRGALLKRNKKKAEISNNVINNITELFSYHINVGHGNCSILLINDGTTKKIWMIDCSDFDFTNKKSYWKNTKLCIDHIKTKHCIDSFHIDKFFLTHTHFDHFSGLQQLLNAKCISKKTECWINLHYSWASPYYNDILAELSELEVTFVEPIEVNSMPNINIWHPAKTVVRSKTTKYKDEDVTEIKHVNNSSVVFQFIFDKTSITFPGDIEKEGWESISKCFPNFNCSSYFCVSHHGSLNGHLRSSCPQGVRISNVSECSNNLKRAILMGRNGAFNGIYSHQVLTDFSKILVKSEECSGKHICCFLEIDLLHNTSRHF